MQKFPCKIIFSTLLLFTLLWAPGLCAASHTHNLLISQKDIQEIGANTPVLFTCADNMKIDVRSYISLRKNTEALTPSGKIVAKHEVGNALMLCNSQLKGFIPSSIGSMGSSMEIFDFSHNALKGKTPVEMGDLESLQVINLIDNQLTGFNALAFKTDPSRVDIEKRNIYVTLFNNGLEEFIPPEDPNVMLVLSSTYPLNPDIRVEGEVNNLGNDISAVHVNAAVINDMWDLNRFHGFFADNVQSAGNDCFHIGFLGEISPYLQTFRITNNTLIRLSSAGVRGLRENGAWRDDNHAQNFTGLLNRVRSGQLRRIAKSANA